MSKLKNKASSKILVITFSFLMMIIIISLVLLVKRSYINQPTTNLPTKEYSSPYPTTKPTSTPPPLTSATPTPKSNIGPPFLTYPNYSIEFDGYIFTTLVDQAKEEAFIVRIPLEKETTVENSEKIEGLKMTFNSLPYAFENRNIYLNYKIDNGRLYISYMKNIKDDYFLLSIFDSAYSQPKTSIMDNNLTSSFSFFDNHLFTTVFDDINRKHFIVKIPLNQEINFANSIKVLDIPQNSHADNDDSGYFYSYDVDFINKNNILFISLSQMYSNSYLYSLHSSQDEPKLILEGNGSARFLNDNNYIFSISGIICSWYCCPIKYYYYNPEKRLVYHLLTAIDMYYKGESYDPKDCNYKLFHDISNHGTLIVGTISSKNDDYSDPYISQIDEYQINPNTNEIKIIPLIAASQMPLTHDIKYHSEKNKLYLLGENIHVLDLETKEFSVFYQLSQIKPPKYRVCEFDIIKDEIFLVCTDFNQKPYKHWSLNLDTKEITEK